MGERPESILGVGCPSSDIGRMLDRTLQPEIVNQNGSGAFIDTSQPFLLALFHPTTTEYGGEREQMDNMLDALEDLRMPTVLLWPNIDAGSDHISRAIRAFRERLQPDWLRTITNLGLEDYLRVLANASCAVGNSSSFIRDASFLGTPVVMVGRRQEGREMDENVFCVPPNTPEITAAVRAQLAHGRYQISTLYGDGYVSERIADMLVVLEPYVQKRLHYIYDRAIDDQIAAFASV
jgi:UDP-N-acetylglucosamine 2-epimerase